MKRFIIIFASFALVRCGDTGVNANIDKLGIDSNGGTTEVDTVRINDLKTGGDGATTVQKVEIGGLGLFGSTGYALFESAGDLQGCTALTCKCYQDKVPENQPSGATGGGGILDIFKNLFSSGTTKRALLFSEVSSNGRYIICGNVKDSDLSKPSNIYAVERIDSSSQINPNNYGSPIQISPKYFGTDLKELQAMYP